MASKHPAGDCGAERNDAACPTRSYRFILALILAIALGLRLYGYDAGLPAINDPDEPLFVMIASKMLAGHLNPGWFGHPGTTTFYSLALVFLGMLLVGIGAGRFGDVSGFISAAYADPSALFAGGRLLMVAFGIASIWLLAILARRLFGSRVALVSAALLAISPIHITYSQVIRTDMQVTLFMLLCLLASLSIARSGRLIAYVAAGIWLGLACATKWPGATFLLSPVCACLYRIGEDRRSAAVQIRRLMLAGATSLATLFLISPYLVLDYGTVIDNLVGEFQAHHLGATGGGFLTNLAWYFTNPIWSSLGPAGSVAAIFGLRTLLRNKPAALLIIPSTLAFLIFISLQTLVWERWPVPLLPLFSLAAALGFCSLWDALRARLGRLPALVSTGIAGVVVAAPLLLAAHAAATERLHDTRNLAAAWVKLHIPGNARILIEHFGLDLLSGPWPLLIPAGDAGCIDGRQAIQGKIGYDAIHKMRAGRAIVDYGTLADEAFGNCAADYAIFSHYDRYAAERAVYPRETARYEAAIRAGRLIHTIRPRPGQIGGPTIRIVRLSTARQTPPNGP